MSKNRLLIGATGLVGHACLEQCRKQGQAPRVLARRRAEGAPAGEDWQLGPDLAALPQAFDAVDCVLCALGTTQKTAGSKAAFAAIDRDLVLQLAAQARAAGVEHWIQVSALGASLKSPSFYSRTKAEADAGLKALGFRRLDILHPSLLLGERQEHRPGEALGQKLAPALNPLLRGRLRRYRAIRAEDVAARMLVLSEQTASGVFHHHFDD